jgi:hypothetical protein
MPSELLLKQFRFSRAVPLLLAEAHAQGWEVTLGECLRSDEQAEINAIGFSGRKALVSLIANAFPLLAKKIGNNTGNGIRNSLHGMKLAIDLQLYRDGVWCGGPSAPQDLGPYAHLGHYWKSLAPDHRWGGDFGDTPHYSIEHDGVK